MLVSISVAAEALGVSPSTLRRWEKEGRFSPTVRRKGGHRRYDLQEILRSEVYVGSSASPHSASPYHTVTRDVVEDIAGEDAAPARRPHAYSSEAPSP